MSEHRRGEVNGERNERSAGHGAVLTPHLPTSGAPTSSAREEGS
ncbi:MAG TPA: hypothetical protein VFP72_11010 [Kineosporiaceae bacterium]|nr:hypothetical protein [Kineosporiaceae bacterium]